jgi:hypothetical protein
MEILLHKEKLNHAGCEFIDAAELCVSRWGKSMNLANSLP